MHLHLLTSLVFNVANKSALHHWLLQDNIDRRAAHIWRWCPSSSHRTAPYNRSPAPDSFSVPSKNEKYDKVQNDYPVVEVEIVLH